MRIFKFASLIVLFSFLSCNLLDSDDNGFNIDVNSAKPNYTLSDTTMIPLTIKNNSKSTIYYSTCNSRTIVELKDSKPVKSIDFTNPCLCICTITVKPDETKELYINGYFINQHKDDLTLTDEVEYQIFPHFYSDKPRNNRISQSVIKSNFFKLTLQ